MGRRGVIGLLAVLAGAVGALGAIGGILAEGPPVPAEQAEAWARHLGSTAEFSTWDTTGPLSMDWQAAEDSRCPEWGCVVGWYRTGQSYIDGRIETTRRILVWVHGCKVKGELRRIRFDDTWQLAWIDVWDGDCRLASSATLVHEVAHALHHQHEGDAWLEQGSHGDEFHHWERVAQRRLLGLRGQLDLGLALH